jgi:hypothetical protein
MAQRYATITAYVAQARGLLQDAIEPYRYTDDQVIDAFNVAMDEIARIRPDIFLDLKYQRPLRVGDTGDGMPPAYTTADISVTGGVYDITKGTVAPIPTKYFMPVNWYIYGWLQFHDVADTQDQRAQAFIQKFQSQLMTVSAA